MTGGVHVKTAAAVRTAVLWVSLCMLLQHLGHHPQFTAEAEGSVQDNIVRYFSYPHSVFQLNNNVNYGSSVDACLASGGSLVSGQSTAAQNAIAALPRSTQNMGYPISLTYMGGNAIYSTQYGPSPQCTAGVQGASLNCVYHWNIDRFATGPSFSHKGVPFYRGSLYSLPGAGPMNGYTPFCQANYPARGNPYLVSQFMFTEGTQATWYDTKVNPFGDPVLGVYGFVVCEVQDSIAGSTLVPTATTIPTTTRPPTTTTTTTDAPTEPPSSSVKKNSYVVPAVSALAFLAFLLLILLCCCWTRNYCCWANNDDSYFITTMIIRECYGDMYRGNNNSSAYNFDYYEDTVQIMQQPQSTYQTMPMYEMPVEQPFDTGYQSRAESNVETSLMHKPSKRQRQRGRTSSNVFSEIEVPKGQEIEEGGDDAALQAVTKLRRGGSVIQCSQEQDVETMEF